MPDERIFSCQSPQNNWKLEYFSRKFFSWKCSYGHLEYTIGNPIGKNWQKTKNFLLSVRKRKKKFKTFFRKIYLPKCSCKHVESSSGSPASFFLTKGRKFFTQRPEMINNFDGFFCQPCWKIFDWMPKSICSVCENLKNYLLFPQKKTFQYDPLDTSKAVFTTLPKSFRQKVENFSLISDKKKQKHQQFFQKI